ncbi:putative hexose transporter [Scheffersomyces stipitis CBS 6054]|uniref:Probable hexose transporter n=1 Tax=Scheffersomyces stipitis (strain ATCC 58785 / CBS 6054 / NBRC 10063 / NRRL Y-11545) TaxID=322104 RepID=A3GFC9_PICST|nr:probable hexose transporter [Scheffersomyces stipitis CBS 6054]EAZ63734.1 putative hexose transporter [Scheffersomyces stipitis CBS 6054]
MSDKLHNIKDQTDSLSITDHIDEQQNILNDPNTDINDLLFQTDGWWKYGHFRKLHFMIALIALASTNNGYDGSMLNGLQAIPDWQTTMGTPEGYKLGSLANGTMFGSIIAVSCASYLNDKWGRKFGVLFGSIISFIGGILQGASTNYAFFLVARIIIGFGVGIALTGAPAWIAELSFPSYRSSCTAVFNTLWYLGAILAAWITFGTEKLHGPKAWRIPSYLQAILPGIQVLTLWFCPESPRWLIDNGKEEKARSVLNAYHTGNVDDERAHALVEFEIKEIKSALELEKLYASSSYFDFLKIRSYRKRLFLVCFTAFIMQMSGNGLVSYYLVKVLRSIGYESPTEQLKINGCLQVFNIVISVGAALLTYRFKRRHQFLVCIAGMLLCYVIWTVLSAINQQRNFEDKGLGRGILAMIFLFYFSYDIGANGLPFLYATEVLPYSHRAKGLNLMYFTQLCTLVYNGYVNPIAMDAIEWKYYIVWCCVLAFELVIVFFFYVETFGYTLEEVAVVFGDDAGTTLHRLSSPVEKSAVEHLEDGNSSNEKIGERV